MQEIGANELPLKFGEYSMRRQSVFHVIGARLERRQQVAMAPLEILKDTRPVGWWPFPGPAPGHDQRYDLPASCRPVLRSLGSVAGLNGRTSTLAGSGRNQRVCRFRNGTCDNGASSRLNGEFGSNAAR